MCDLDAFLGIMRRQGIDMLPEFRLINMIFLKNRVLHVPVNQSLVEIPNHSNDVLHEAHPAFRQSEEKGIFQPQPLLVFIAQIQRRPVFEVIAGGAGRTLIFADELGPLDADFRVVPGHAAFIIGMPEIIDLIAEFRHVAEDQEPMGKAFGNEELLLIFFRQFDTVPFAIRLGSVARSSFVITLKL